MTAVAMHPENAENILKLLNRDQPTEDREEFAERMNDQDMESYVPIQLRPEKQDILRDLQEFGVILLDDEG